MPSVTIRKADKVLALNAMVEAKYRDKYAALVVRRRNLTVRVYQETVGLVGEKLKDSAKRRTKGSGFSWRFWLGSKDELCLAGVAVPGLVAIPSTKLRRPYYQLELFSGEQGKDSLDPDNTYVVLPDPVAWPVGSYGSLVDVASASLQTRNVARTLDRDITKFNKEVAEFYDKVWCVLEHLRTSKRVDEMFPELWAYLPTGLRERIKQAVVPITQDEVDAVRMLLPRRKS